MEYTYDEDDSQNTHPDALRSLEQSKINPSTSSKSMAQRKADPQSVTKRLQQELMTLMISPTPGISAFPSSTSLLKWTATMLGPSSTPFENLTFKLSLSFPAEYPYVAPTILFRTPIYHPNVDFSGRICLDILKDKWSAVMNIQGVLLSLQSLLGEPNNSSPLNGEAARLWDTDMEEFKRKVLARHRDLDDEEMEE